MLDLMTSGSSTSAVIHAIKYLTNDTSYAKFTGLVSAIVGDNTVIDQEEIEVHLTYNRPNYASIDIMWEECGCKDYKKLRLYGRMNTQYQEVRAKGKRRLLIISTEYEIEIQY